MILRPEMDKIATISKKKQLIKHVYFVDYLKELNQIHRRTKASRINQVSAAVSNT